MAFPQHVVVAAPRIGRGPAWRYVALVIAALATLSLLPAGSAHADPKVSAAAAAEQLQSLSDKAEILVEAFDAAQDQLSSAQQQYATDQASIAAAEKAVSATQVQTDDVARALYTAGDIGGVEAVLDASDPAIALQRAGILSMLSDQRTEQLRVATAARNRLAQTQASAAQLLSSMQSLQASLNAQQKTINAMIAKQQTLLAASQAQEAAQQAAQQKAEAAASAAAAAQAARASRTSKRAALPKPVVVAPQPKVAAPVISSAVYTGLASGRAAVALKYAFSQLGKPYRYGGAGARTFDCSGLTMRAWQSAGVALEHNAAAQYRTTTHVARNALQPGDLVYFGRPIHHVGIYIGGGRFIEAPYTGADIRISSLSSRHDYAGASRP